MINNFLEHYKRREKEAEQKLKEFEKKKNSEEIFEEMTFCVFAANSSAEMGLLAVTLLKPVIHKGSLDDYKQRTYKKVRFYNKRSEYLFYNREKIKNEKINLLNLLKKEPEEKRLFVKENFKGFGFKEASHFLRNTGTKGLCIIDKHVLNVMFDLKVIKKKNPPKNLKEYLNYEKKIKSFAKKYNLDVDVLDLVMWSYKTGKILK